MADAAVGADSSEHQISQVLSGLAPGTTYHYRLVASNCAGCQAGTAYGPDEVLLTAAPIAVLTKPAAPVPTPALGRAGVAAVLSGTVLVTVPGSASPVVLSASAAVPVGSLIDASRGTLRLTTAIDRRGHTQSALLWGGAFVLHQGAARGGMTTLTLAGALSCPVSGHRARDLRVASATKRKPPRRSLWAHDNHGNYTTRGYNSVATVRGTIWETVDTCSGTLTRVKKGTVVVRDLRAHRSVVVRAGHSYLAKR